MLYYYYSVRLVGDLISFIGSTIGEKFFFFFFLLGGGLFWKKCGFEGGYLDPGINY